MLWRSASELDRIVTTCPRSLNVRILDGPGEPQLNWSRAARVSFAESEASSVADRSLEVGIPKKSTVGPPGSSAFKNPTYPPRVHFLERAAILDGLRSCDERLQTIKQKLELLGNHPQKAAHERVYHQMLVLEIRSRKRPGGYRWRPARSTTKTRSDTRSPWPPSTASIASGTTFGDGSRPAARDRGSARPPVIDRAGRFAGERQGDTPAGSGRCVESMDSLDHDASVMAVLAG